MKHMTLYRLLTFLILVSLLTSACGAPAATPANVKIAETTAPTQEPSPTPTAPPPTATPNPTPTPVPPTPSPTPEPTPTPLSQERTVHVTALAYYTNREGRADGTAHTMTVTVRRKEEPGLRVGIFNSEVEGTGPMWRASAWSAVTFASLLLGVNPEHFEFSFDAGGGRIDGPSAGGLTTVAVLAALLGDDVREDAAMTGTINPDGTIGPVGGIPQKIMGAKKKGKTLVLIPAGQRYDYDQNLQENVDVIEKGKKEGITVREVGDIFEAYEILTGKPLPYLPQTGSIDMPARAYEKMRAHADEYLARYHKAVETLHSLSKDAQEGREPDYGHEQARLAQQAIEQGLGALAMQRAWEAAWDAESSLQAAQLDEAYNQHGLNGVIDMVKASMSSRADFDAVVQKLKAEAPRSASETIALMNAWSDLAIALGYKSRGDELVNYVIKNEKKLKEDKELDYLYEAAYDYYVASIYLDATRKDADMGYGFGTAPPPDPNRMAVMADLMRHAADANMALFDSIIVNALAEQNDISMQRAKSWLMEHNEDYADAMYARAGVNILWDEVWEEPERSQMIYGCSLAAWGNSAMLIAKYYSLGARKDKNGEIVAFRHERALDNMLDLSIQRTKEAIQLVSAEEPATPLYYAEVGKMWQHGTPEEQVLSLYYEWQATLFAQTLAYFTGGYGEAIKAELERTNRPTELLSYWDLPAQ